VGNLILPERFYPLKSHGIQDQLKACTKPFVVVPAGRRGGKSEIAKRKLVKEALKAIGGRWTKNYFFAAAPTRDQAKRIYWEDLKALVPSKLVTNIVETTLTIEIAHCSYISVIGMDKPQRIEGSPWNGGILDEYADMKASAWGENVAPALADRDGWCWQIGVPEGRNHYYDQYRYALDSGDPEWAAFTWKSSDILPPHVIERYKRTLDLLTYQQEFEASFVNFTGQAYYAFDDATHCHRLEYDPHKRVAFCFDFNVSPGVAGIIQEQKLPNGLMGSGIIGEVHIPRNSNTVRVCNKLIEDWGDHQGKIALQGDATGGASGSAKVQGSDWDLIKSTLSNHYGNQKLIHRVPRANGAERVRVNTLNTRLLNANDEVRMMVDPSKAPHVVKDFEGVRVLEGGSGEIDKDYDKRLTHHTDYVGYYVVREFPIGSRHVQKQEYSGH
jgi:hypothetical protein